MRVVYLNPCGQLGGAETSLLELLASVRAAAPSWELWLVLGEDGPVADQARRRGVQVVVAPFPAALARLGDAGIRPSATLGRLLTAAAGAARYTRRLARILKSLEPDIVHSNGFKTHLLGAWARPWRTPLVWHIHEYVSARRLMRRLLSAWHKSCDVAIVNSNSVAQDLRSLLPGLKMATIYNAIDLTRFSPTGPKLDLDKMAGLGPAPPDAVRVGIVATFAHWKGHKVFLQALARVFADTTARGYIIGGAIYHTDGSQWLRQELEQEASRLGLGDRVGFTGFVADTAAAMRSLDIVVHASTRPEPFGMAIIEAMACGKAVIASQAGGAMELFTDGENALAHPPGDVTALAGQIRRLIRDEPLRRKLGAAARESSERAYGGARLARELLTVYQQTCDSAANGGQACVSIQPEIAAAVSETWQER
jgi:glycosyltransferase involved in cell wall biosynthesis